MIMASEIVISGTKRDLLWQLSEMALDPEEIYILKGGVQGKKYSLNALNYCWRLMDDIAKHPAIKSTKQEVYLDLLRRVGVFFYAPLLPENVDTAREVYRIVIDRGETVLTNQKGKTFTFHTCQCYKGIHAYDSKEMARFIDEIVEEAKALGIETATPDELEEMKAKWGEKK